jgi:hypothetical protein
VWSLTLILAGKFLKRVGISNTAVVWLRMLGPAATARDRALTLGCWNPVGHRVVHRVGSVREKIYADLSYADLIVYVHLIHHLLRHIRVDGDWVTVEMGGCGGGRWRAVWAATQKQKKTPRIGKPDSMPSL